MNEIPLRDEQESGAAKLQPAKFTASYCEHTLGEYSIKITSRVRHSIFSTHGHNNELSLFELSPEDIEALAMVLLKESMLAQAHHAKARAEANKAKAA